MDMLTKCPECGGKIQATRDIEIYYTLIDGEWINMDSEEQPCRVYCENDHEIDADLVNPVPDTEYEEC